MKRYKLYLQLYPSYLVILLVGFTLITIPSSWFLAKSNEAQVEEQLSKQADYIKKLLPILPDLKEQKAWDRFFRDAPFRLTLIEENGGVLYDNQEEASKMENHADRPEMLAALQGKDMFSKRYSNTLQLNMLYYATRAGNGIIVRVAKPVQPMLATIHSYLVKIFLTALIVAVFAVFVSFYMGQRLTRPLGQLEEQANMLTSQFLQGEREAYQDFTFEPSRNESFKTQEFHQLSETMNRMALQLLKEVNRQRNQSNLHQALLKSMAESVLAVDREGVILSCNQSAMEMYQLSGQASPVGANAFDLLKHPILLGAIQEIMATGNAFSREVRILNPTERSVEITVTPLKGSDGSQIGAVMVGQDLTGAKALARMRKDFVANVSHELKTPITAIKGYIETLMSDACSTREERDMFLAIALKHTDRMTSIINDLLSLSKLEDRQQDFELQDMPLKPIIEEVLLACKEHAAKKQIKIVLEPGKWCFVRGNVLLLEQAIFNLLDNAIKYSPDGTQILVRIEDLGSYSQVDIIDEGEGIPEKYRGRIFERFFRLDKGRSKKAGGTGLGLSIVKHIIGIHQGQVFVCDGPGKGSMFSVQIPNSQFSPNRYVQS